jgi:uncharacterized protein YvpB
MKKNRTINLLFIGVVALLVILAVLAFIDHPPMQTATSENHHPSLDVALSVTQTIQDILSKTETARPTITSVSPTLTPLPPTPTPFVLPEQSYIDNFHGHQQYYSIGCEASAAVDLAEYYNVNIYQYDFQMGLLHNSDNPDIGFVGDVNGPWGQIPPYAYGVYAGPVADLLNKYGVDVVSGKGYTLDQIKASLAKHNPVMVWVISSMTYSTPVKYTDKAGNTTIVAPYEHVVILIGYNETSVRYVSNGHYADVTNEIFLRSWGVLGNMAVMHK